jgi:iron complex transport system substrate-binding protein
MLTRLIAFISLSVLLTTHAAAQDAPVCEPGFRLFTHELLWSETAEGVCIPEQPQRIAYSWVFHIPALLRENYPFAGIANQDYVVSQFPEWEAIIRTIPDIELPANPEATLEINPDVIIEPDWAAQDNYEELSAIAPVVVFQFEGTHQWKQLVELYFEVAGLPEAYDILIAEYEGRAKELSELIGNPQDTNISLVWVFEDKFYLDTNYSSGGILLQDIGFALADNAVFAESAEEIIEAGEYPYFKEISWEEVQQVDADFIIAYGDFGTSEELQINSLWQNLSAVKTGKVYYTSQNWAGGDIAAAHNLLDDVAMAFGVADQFSPNPYKTAPEIESTPEASS